MLREVAVLLICVCLRNVNPFSGDIVVETPLTCKMSIGERLPSPGIAEKSKDDGEEQSYPEFRPNADAEGRKG